MEAWNSGSSPGKVASMYAVIGSSFKSFLAKVGLKQTGAASADHPSKPAQSSGAPLATRKITTIPTVIEGSSKWPGAIPIRSTAYGQIRLRQIRLLAEEYGKEKHNDLPAWSREEMGRRSMVEVQEQEKVSRLYRLEDKLRELISAIDKHGKSENHTPKASVADLRADAVNELNVIQRFRRDWVSKRLRHEPLPSLTVATATHQGSNISLRRFDYVTFNLPLEKNGGFWTSSDGFQEFDGPDILQELDDYERLKYSPETDNLTGDVENPDSDLLEERLSELSMRLEDLHSEFYKRFEEYRDSKHGKLRDVFLLRFNAYTSLKYDQEMERLRVGDNDQDPADLLDHLESLRQKLLELKQSLASEIQEQRFEKEQETMAGDLRRVINDELEVITELEQKIRYGERLPTESIADAIDRCANPVEFSHVKAFVNGFTQELRAINQLRDNIVDDGNVPTEPLADAIDRLWYGMEVFEGPVKT